MRFTLWIQPLRLLLPIARYVSLRGLCQRRVDRPHRETRRLQNASASHDFPPVETHLHPATVSQQPCWPTRIVREQYFPIDELRHRLPVGQFLFPVRFGQIKQPFKIPGKRRVSTQSYGTRAKTILISGDGQPYQ